MMEGTVRPDRSLCRGLRVGEAPVPRLDVTKWLHVTCQPSNSWRVDSKSREGRERAGR